MREYAGLQITRPKQRFYVVRIGTTMEAIEIVFTNSSILLWMLLLRKRRFPAPRVDFVYNTIAPINSLSKIQSSVSVVFSSVQLLQCLNPAVNKISIRIVFNLI